MAKRLYVGNLSTNVTPSQIQELFAQVGVTTEVSLIADRHTGTSKGFAFVEMASDEAAQEAIKRFNGTLLDDRALNVSEARPRGERFSGPQLS